MQREIEHQHLLGVHDLHEEDQYLSEVNLKDLTFFGRAAGILVAGYISSPTGRVDCIEPEYKSGSDGVSANISSHNDGC